VLGHLLVAGDQRVGTPVLGGVDARK
jgi:hypothetical protein